MEPTKSLTFSRGPKGCQVFIWPVVVSNRFFLQLPRPSWWIWLDDPILWLVTTYPRTPSRKFKKKSRFYHGFTKDCSFLVGNFNHPKLGTFFSSPDPWPPYKKQSTTKNRSRWVFTVSFLPSVSRICLLVVGPSQLKKQAVGFPPLTRSYKPWIPIWKRNPTSPGIGDIKITICADYFQVLGWSPPRGDLVMPKWRSKCVGCK